MKKSAAFILCLLLIGVIVIAIIISSNKKKDTVESTSNPESQIEEKIQESEIVESTEEESKEGYEILVSKKEITIKEGTTESFEITFTNPDETSIREFIHSDDQDDIIEVRYTPLENKKTTVEVEGLKIGKTEILISDYEYPDTKVYVKVNVVE